MVEVDAGVFGGAWGLLVGGEQGVLESVHQLVGADALLLLERFDCVDDLFAHGDDSLVSDVVLGATVLRPRRGNLERVLGAQVVEVVGDPFAERQADPVGMVDEEAQRLAARLLDGDQVEVRVELGQLLLNVLL